MSELTRFQRLAQAFDELDELEHQAAQERLETIQAEDPDFATELRKMLNDRTAAADCFPEQDVPSQGQLIGSHVSGYELVELLGEGGMGQVYLAERREQAFTHKAAVKVLPFSWSTQELRSRFEQECAILCKFEHPNLPRFIDGGVHDDGHSYLIMEYIDGTSLVQACEKQNQEQILRLFLEVCEAVGFAHRHLVIHRDIKMDNILVDKEGRVKLLDFGIAKVLDPDHQADATQVARLTPRFASPEQLRGEALSTSTDIYSLGAVLYELLCGEKFPGAAEIKGDIHGYLRPKHLPQDLKAILGMALAADVQDRYESVGVLAQEIRRFCDKEPVIARKAGFIYRLNRLAVRHKLPFALGLTALLSLVLGLGMAIHQSRNATQARDHQREVSAFLVGLFEGTEPELAEEPASMMQLLEQGRLKVDQELSDQPLLRAELHAILGRIFVKLRRFRDAEQQLEAYADIHPKPWMDPENWFLAQEHYAEAKIKLEDYQAGTTVLNAIRPLAAEAEDQRSVGVIDGLLGLAAARQGEWEAADTAFHAAIEVLKTCESITCEEELAKVYINQGNAYIDRNQLDEALVCFQNAEALPSTEDNEGINLVIKSNLAVIQVKTGKLVEAVTSYQDLIRIRKQRYGPDSVRLAANYQNLAHAFLRQGKHTEAREHFQEAYRLYAREDTMYPAFSLVGLSKSHLEENDFEAATSYARDAVEIISRFQDSGIYLAQARFVLGSALIGIGEKQEGKQLMILARDAFIKTLGENHQLTQGAIEALGKL